MNVSPGEIYSLKHINYTEKNTKIIEPAATFRRQKKEKKNLTKIQGRKSFSKEQNFIT